MVCFIVFLVLVSTLCMTQAALIRDVLDNNILKHTIQKRQACGANCCSCFGGCICGVPCGAIGCGKWAKYVLKSEECDENYSRVSYGKNFL